MQGYEIEGRETLWEGRFPVREATVRLVADDGSERRIRRTEVTMSDSVAALVHDVERDEFILVRQFRLATEGHGMPFMLETVAGAIDPGETPDRSIRREIEEEIGYRVKTPIPVAQFFPSCGRITELVHVYYAMVSDADRTGAGGGSDQDEAIEIVRMRCERALAMLQNPQPLDAKLLVALQWYALSGQEHRVAGERGRV